ncbi:DUF397 domain-containing protein [Micromonospora siamensis]|uniref:DUF397 domain-containing protein n=1 Tax=Micromonospora siamensis TaxID=299152 RepID=A0A1C5GQA6_9ACTN|nr:DUF397 domain-containing protein [Micromonospora siamensis]SCG35281.1 protein of unknown function [Micromonospora siamensis]
MTDLVGAVWRTSSRSNDQGLCVEVADNLVGVVGVRDSKDPAGPALVVSPPGWTAFVRALRAGRLRP